MPCIEVLTESAAIEASEEEIIPQALLSHGIAHVRIDRHYGQVVAEALGVLGNRKETLIGDAVNVASRFEAANKEVGSKFLIRSSTAGLMKKFVGKPVEVNLPGKNQLHNLYEVFDLN